MTDPRYPPNCVACQHVDFDFDRGYYGDSPAFIRCYKGHFSEELDDTGTTSLRELLRQAATCPDFTLYAPPSPSR